MAQILANLKLELDMERVLRGQGADLAAARPREYVLAIIREMLTEARRLMAPAVVYELYPLREIRHHRLILENGHAFQSGQVAGTLASAQEIAVLIGTIGYELEERASRYFDEGHPAKGTILDGIGSAAVEELTERACHVIEELAAARGMRTSILLSPGYLDWPLDEQRVLFDLLPADEIGVMLSPACLMIPRKSVSMIVGLGKGLKAEGRSACDACSIRATCRYRKPTESGQRQGVLRRPTFSKRSEVL